MKNLPKTILTTGVLAACLVMGNQPAAWTSVTFTSAQDDAPLTVSLKAEDALSSVTIVADGKTLSVPEEELEAIDLPQLETAKLLLGEDYYGAIEEGEEPIPHQIIEMSYGTKSDFGTYAIVKFLFHSGAYQFQTSLTQKTPTTWVETQKYPGEDSIELGTATKPAK